MTHTKIKENNVPCFFTIQQYIKGGGFPALHYQNLLLVLMACNKRIDKYSKTLFKQVLLL